MRASRPKTRDCIIRMCHLSQNIPERGAVEYLHTRTFQMKISLIDSILGTCFLFPNLLSDHFQWIPSLSLQCRGWSYDYESELFSPLLSPLHSYIQSITRYFLSILHSRVVSLSASTILIQITVIFSLCAHDTVLFLSHLPHTISLIKRKQK